MRKDVMQPKAARNISIEALRLIAVAGIAIFHTFQWTFQAVWTGLPEYTPLTVFPYSGILGFINLLGQRGLLYDLGLLPYYLGRSRLERRGYVDVATTADNAAPWQSHLAHRVLLPRGAHVVHGRLPHSRCCS